MIKAKFPILKGRYRGRRHTYFYQIVAACLVLWNLSILLGDTETRENIPLGEDADMDNRLFHFLTQLELGDEEDAYFHAQEFQGHQDQRLRAKLVEQRWASGPHPGDSDSDSSSDESSDEENDAAVGVLFSSDEDNDSEGATSDDDDLYT